MLHIQNITKSYRDDTVLDGVELAVNPGEVIALVGANGAGKTTLLKIILGEVKPDEGNVILANEVIGYLPQEIDLGKTVRDSFPKEVEDWHIDKVLEAVDLTGLDLDTLVDKLSGGQRTRLGLARVLSHEPEPTILLLDEPTNNLDQSGLEWLASFIKIFRGGIILVGHDRAFINQVVTSVAELDKGKLRYYGGDYDFYQEQKAIEHNSELQQYEQSTEERKRLEQLVYQAKQKAGASSMKSYTLDNDKFAAGFKNDKISKIFSRKGKALESRIKHLKEVDRPEEFKRYETHLAGQTPDKKQLVILENVSKSFRKKPVLRDVSLLLNGRERVRISGPNGSGKTTLLQLAAGRVTPDEGEVRRGDGIRIGYFSQDVFGLDEAKTARDNLLTVSIDSTRVHREARSLGLTQADLSKMPQELSRGQQAKLAFAKLLLAENQLLILDEPTNHLDIPTRENIEAALARYGGAILVASHDSYFVDRLSITSTYQLQSGTLTH